MKCPRCNGRKFTVAARHVMSVEYTDNGTAMYGRVKEFLGVEEDTHYCLECKKMVDDDKLIMEKNTEEL